MTVQLHGSTMKYSNALFQYNTEKGRSVVMRVLCPVDQIAAVRGKVSCE